MKNYKKPTIAVADVHMRQALMTASPNQSYEEEGNGVQLTRRQIWTEEEE